MKDLFSMTTALFQIYFINHIKNTLRDEKFDKFISTNEFQIFNEKKIPLTLIRILLKKYDNGTVRTKLVLHSNLQIERYFQKLIHFYIPVFGIMFKMSLVENSSSFASFPPEFIRSFHLDEIGPHGHSARFVFGHSFWSSLQAYAWWKEKNPLFLDPDLNLYELIYASFFHDIAKAMDCNVTCLQNTCFLDTYAKNKYEGKSHRIHPEYSGDILLGKKGFDMLCDFKSGPWHFSKQFFTVRSLDQRTVALTAYMHWEFGNINCIITNANGDEKKISKAFETYLTKFVHYCKIVETCPSIPLLKKCILVSLTDICAGAVPSICNTDCLNMDFIFSDVQGRIWKKHEIFFLTYLFFRSPKFLNPFYKSKEIWKNQLNDHYLLIYNRLLLEAKKLDAFFLS